MRLPSLSLLLLLGLAALASASERRLLGEDAGGAIVNGQDASPTRYRYYTFLKFTAPDGRGFTCGGTLIAPTVVLTAAHCALDPSGNVFPAANVQVFVGEYYYNVNTPHNRVARGVKEVVPHPDYNGGTSEWDVAVLHLNLPVNSIEPVKLVGSVPKPNWNNPAPNWTGVTVVGLGEIQYGGPMPTVLQEIGLTLLPLRRCEVLVSAAARRAGQQLQTTFMTNTQICSLRVTAPGAECRGDSGGPMLVKGASMAEDVQIGVVSWSYKTPREEACLAIPGVFSDVGATFPWVDAQVLRLTSARLVPGVLPIRPFTPLHGRVFGNMGVQGFDGSAFIQPGLPDQTLFIVLSFHYSFIGRMVQGSRANTVALGAVGFTWGDTVYMRLEGGQLVASLVRDGPPLSRGQTVPLISGSLEVYADKPGRNRRVDIIKPGVEVQVVQPWIKTSNGGYYAQRLDVWYTLTQRPAGPLVGFLGATYQP